MNKKQVNNAKTILFLLRPGTEEARSMGCICGYEEYNKNILRSESYKHLDKPNYFIVSKHCPLHEIKYFPKKKVFTSSSHQKNPHWYVIML
jgi:hypothetical protein